MKRKCTRQSVEKEEALFPGPGTHCLFVCNVCLCVFPRRRRELKTENSNSFHLHLFACCEMNYATDRLDRQSREGGQSLLEDFEQASTSRNHSLLARICRNVGWNRHAVYHSALSWMETPNSWESAGEVSEMYIHTLSFEKNALTHFFLYPNGY
jgi:hypothetical protein